MLFTGPCISPPLWLIGHIVGSPPLLDNCLVGPPLTLLVGHLVGPPPPLLVSPSSLVDLTEHCDVFGGPEKDPGHCHLLCK